MKILLGFIFIIPIYFGSLCAQIPQEDKAVVICDEKVDSLLNLHVELNKKFPVFQGYRIQILMVSGNDALDVTGEAQTEFLEKYPDIPVYLTFGEPNYRVRVGDFRTRLEAEKFLGQIDRKYPGAWVTQDNINFPVLSKYKNNSYE
jgi:sporulation related protein